MALARAWESSKQNPIGYPKDTALRLESITTSGSVRRRKRPFNPSALSRHWRWFFDYGTGDLGNDGVHRLDFARRALSAAFEGEKRTLPDWPVAVSASGGKLVFDDAQEWPDTLVAVWDYPGASLIYEMRVWNQYPFEGEEEGAAVYGLRGMW